MLRLGGKMMAPKFRAWNKRSEIYLYNVQDAYDTLSGFVKYENGENADYDESCFGDFLDNKWYVVEQFTGLKDANGKDIYEGDIVTVQATNDDGSTDGMLGKIVYDEDIASFEFTTTGEDGWYTSSFDNLFEEGFFDIHVIGNMHTNPELLEE